MDSLVAHVLAWVATTVLGALAGFLVSLLRRQFGREKALAKDECAAARTSRRYPPQICGGGEALHRGCERGGG